MRPSRVDAVLRRCASQRGLVTYRQLSALEVTPRELRTLLRLGVLVRAQPEVYRVGGVATDRAAQMWAAVLAVTKGRQDATRTAAVSQASAAELLGTGRIDPPERPEITVVGHRLPLLWDVDVHRTRRLEPCDVQKIDGLPVTTGARTGIDLAARLDRVTRTARSTTSSAAATRAGAGCTVGPRRCATAGGG